MTNDVQLLLTDYKKPIHTANRPENKTMAKYFQTLKDE